MDWLRVAGGLADALLSLVYLLALTVIVAQTVRRVLGVRVGWPRAFLVCALAIMVLLTAGGRLITSGAVPLDPQHAGGLGAYFLVLTLWTFALSAAALLVLEIMVPTGSLPPLRSLVFGWGRRWRRGRRYARIVGIAVRHGLGAPLRGFRPAEGDEARLAASLRDALQEGGVTFVKLGQMLSTRADLLPDAYVRSLARLTNRAEAEPWDAVRGVLEAELGRPVGQVFASIDTRPLASASVAQVHSATLPDGRDVVVKVQRPGAVASVAGDLEILGRLADSLERNAGWARAIGLRGLARGFADSLREELDYRVEIDNMAAVRPGLQRRGVRVPWVADALCTPRVIVMERFTGTPVAQASALIDGLTLDQRQQAAGALLGSMLGEIIGDGVFHADLHPGNVVLWPDGAVGLLDFGAVGRLDAVTRRTLGTLLWAIDADDPVTATDALLELLDAPDDLDERALQRSVGTLMTRFRGGLGPGGSLAVFGELFGLVVQHGFRVPPMVAAALRSLGALEGTLRLIDPDLDLVGVAREVGRDSVGEITPERVRAELTQRALHVLPLLERLPRRIGKITEDLEQGRFTTHVRVASHADDRAFLTGLVQQLVVAVLAAAGLLGGIVLVTASGGPEVLPGVGAHMLVGSLVAFAGFVLGLRSVAMVFGARGR